MQLWFFTILIENGINLFILSIFFTYFSERRSCPGVNKILGFIAVPTMAYLSGHLTYLSECGDTRSNDPHWREQKFALKVIEDKGGDRFPFMRRLVLPLF
jgi:hypothetical protein